MHDFILAKEIIEKVLDIIKEKNLSEIKSVSLEIGSISLAHDNLPEHVDDISLESLEFGLRSLAQNTILKDTRFKIKKIKGTDWRITNVEV